MSKSLRVKLVFIILLIIVLLMTVVLVFLTLRVQSFFTSQFYDQMDSVFEETEIVRELRSVASRSDAVSRMDDILRLFSGLLGIDQRTRNYYILDKATAEVLETSNPDRSNYIDITPNILSAMIGEGAYAEGSSRAEYMDVAVPITVEGASGFVVYIIDNKGTVSSLNTEIMTLILEAVLIGFVIAIAITLIVSKTLLSPIQGMTKAAEAMADGDFSRKIKVDSKDEIGILAETFNDMAMQIETMLEELKNAEKLRREFVANVSHELRTPLTSIRTYAETISDTQGIPEDTEEEFLRVIINECDRMTKIVSDLLVLSRLDSGTGKLTQEWFSIEKAVRDVYAAIALEARKHGHVLNLEIEWKMPMIKGDRARIEQVLMNIISNALKYTPDGGAIDIYVNRSSNEISIRVEDTGIGIPREDLGRVFDRFYRVDKARTRESGGTGLGLSIAKEIVTMHGGAIEIDSELGVGTIVSITLPIEGGTAAD